MRKQGQDRRRFGPVVQFATPHLIEPEWKAAMFAAWRNNDQVEMARLNTIHESCREPNVYVCDYHRAVFDVTGTVWKDQG